MSQTLPNISAATTITAMQTLGNANANGTSVDLQGYKGPVTFVMAIGRSSVGSGEITVANVQTFTADTAASYADVSGGNFTATGDTSAAANTGIQTKTFDVRALSRWVRCPITVTGTNANVPVNLFVIGQKERV